jgi:hypothetical protein
VENHVAHTFKYLVSANEYSSLDPIRNAYNVTSDDIINKDTTVVASNCSSQDQVHTHLQTQPRKWVTAACILLGPMLHETLNAFTIATLHTIADTGAMSIFIMDGINIANKCRTLKPLTINLPNSKKGEIYTRVRHHDPRPPNHFNRAHRAGLGPCIAHWYLSAL